MGPISQEEAFSRIVIVMAESKSFKKTVSTIVKLPTAGRSKLIADLKNTVRPAEYRVLSHLEDQSFCDRVQSVEILN